MSLLATVSDCLNVWSYEDEKFSAKSSFTNPEESFHSVAWNHTNQVVAIGGSSSKIDLIQANNGQLLSSLPVSETYDPGRIIKSIAFSSNSRFIATGVRDVIQLWDLKNRRRKLSLRSGNNAVINAVSFLPNGDVLSGDQFGKFFCWDPQNSEEGQPVFHEFTNNDASFPSSEVNTMHVSTTNSNNVATGYSNGYLCTWNVEHLIMQRRQRCHNGALTSLCYSPRNGRLVAACGTDGRVVLVDTSSKSSTYHDISAVIDIPGKQLTGLTFHENAIHVAVTSDDGNLLLYDWRNVNQPVTAVQAHKNLRINAVAFQIPKVTSPSPKPNLAASTMSVDSIKSALSVKSTAVSEAVSNSSSINATAAAPAAASSAKRQPTPPPTMSAALSRAADLMERATKSPKGSTAASSRPGAAPIVSDAVGPTSAIKQSKDSLASIAAPAAPKLGAKSPGPAREQPSSTTSAGSSFREKYFEENELPVAPTSVRTTQQAGPASVRGGAQSGNSGSSFDFPNMVQSPPRSKVGAAASAAAADAAVRSPKLKRAIESDTLNGSSSHGRGGMENSSRSGNLTREELEEALDLLRYDIHREVQLIVKEQIRQFAIAKEDNEKMIENMSQQLESLLKANKELRAENEYLRRTY